MSPTHATLQVILAATVALPLSFAMPAAAQEVPAPAGDDPRVRVIAYNPQQVVKLYAAPGATLTIQLAAGETVAGLPVSDQTLLDHPEPDGPGPLAAAGGRPALTCWNHPANWPRRRATARRAWMSGRWRRRSCASTRRARAAALRAGSGNQRG